MKLPFFDRKKIQDKAKKESQFNTEQMLPVSEIKWDTVILKDWGLRWILKVEWLNLDLKNYDEQQLVLQQYKKFINSMNFPLQILIRNTYLDLSEYIDYMKANVSAIDNSVLEASGNDYVGFLEDIDLKTGLIYVKEFYIIVPYYINGAENSQVNKAWWAKLLDILSMKDSVEKVVSRYRDFLQHEKFLNTRCAVIDDWLRSLWMQVTRLWLSDIVSLLFRSYNPTVHASQSTFVD